MKNLSCFLILCLLSIQIVQAQLGYSSFEEGTEQYLIADDVNIRDKPTTTSGVLGNMPIGTPIKILKKMEKTSKIKGHTAPWYHVQIDHIKGYIWGGLIASGMRSTDNGLMFMYGVDRVEKVEVSQYYTEERITMQVRVAQNSGKELDKITFKGITGISNSNEIEYFEQGADLEGIKRIMVIQSNGGFCGAPSGNMYVFWDGEQLHHAKNLDYGSDIPVFFSQKFIFPMDEGGKSGKIILHEQAGEYLDDGTTEYRTNEKIPYVWTGTKLRKVE
ncbi:MAG: SH3 domain-containing protein [Saprospiraceae bacterium]|nr:SH3 domain-containing protein [Saprospiraceae bacterium]